MRNFLALSFLGFFLLAGCVTPAPPTVKSEAPVPQPVQIQAQQQAQTPVVKTYKRKIAIGRFTNETNYGRALLSDEQFERIGKQASDMLSSKLVQSEKFIVLERPDLNKIQKEQSLSGVSGLVGVETLIIGSVTEFGRSTTSKMGFMSSTKLQTAKAKVEVRLVDIKTGHAFFSAVGGGEASTEVGEVAGFGQRADYDATLNDKAINAAISDMIDKLVSKLEEKPWRSDILEVQSDSIFITGGERQGIKMGDSLKVMQRGEIIKSRQSGFEIELPAKEVAEAKVVSFFGDSLTNEGSVCYIISGTVDKDKLDKLFVAEGKVK